MYPTSIDNISIALEELRLTVPDAIIGAITPAANGNIIFETGNDYYYVWDCRSGCVMRKHKNDWRHLG